jgi:hypothetical protein
VTDERSLLQTLLGDARFLIGLTGISLALSGGFAVLQSVSGQLLPHDSHAIGMDAMALMQAGNPHLLGFMFHDRVAYGGSLLAIGGGYLWLAEFPMSARASWAWWALLFSGGIGFLAFLTYLGQGYLDTWHGVATLFLLPVYVTGMWRSRPSKFSLRSVWISNPKGENVFAKWGRISVEHVRSRADSRRGNYRHFWNDHCLCAIGPKVHRVGEIHAPPERTDADSTYFARPSWLRRRTLLDWHFPPVYVALCGTQSQSG